MLSEAYDEILHGWTRCFPPIFFRLVAQQPYWTSDKMTVAE
jgi:hypothetical protein